TLKSTKNGRTCVGMTTDFPRRLKEHNLSKHGYTKLHQPWEALEKKTFETRAEARAREQYLKTAAGRRYISKIYSEIV
ncbi:MAG: GIY-YIG nuclease family protein, partial [Patescibacteria group bacterium]